jgi:hypothetical protein
MLPSFSSINIPTFSICIRFQCGVYTNCKKYVPIDFANSPKVIASKAKQSNAKHHDPLRRIRLLRRKAPRNDGLSKHISDNRYNPKYQVTGNWKIVAT